jgi:hypothetical protein
MVDYILDFVSFVIGLIILILVTMGMLFVLWTTILVSYKITLMFWKLLFDFSIGF